MAEYASDVSVHPSLCHFSLTVNGSAVASMNIACFATHTLMRSKWLSRVEFMNKVQNCCDIEHVPIGRRHDIARWHESANWSAVQFHRSSEL